MKNGWQTKTLGEICEMYQPKTISGKDMVEDGAYLVYGANGVIGRYNQFNHEEPQLLITCRGATCGSVNISAPRSWVTGNAMVVRPKDESLEMRYLEYLFRGGIDIAKAITGAAQPQITRTNLEPLEISFPESLAEQQRIVGLLDEAFVGIATAKANAEKNLQNARALFESHLHAEHAEKAMLGDLVNIKTGKLDANAAVEGGEFPFFTCSRDILSIDTYAFDCEAILLAGNNAVGDFNVKHYSGKFNAYQRTYVITVNEKKSVLYRFLYFQMLKSLKRFKAQSVGSGTKFLKLGMINELEIELPSLDEQQRIASTTDSMHEQTQCLARLYERKLAALEALKKSLLHQAFSGEI
jgi:type I restriction enzyme S subunit